MRRLYLDTFLVVAALVHEAGTATALVFLQEHARQPWLISSWVATELASVLGLQIRRSAITPQESQDAWQRFLVLCGQRQTLQPLAAEDFEVVPVSAWFRCRRFELTKPYLWLSVNG